jgi:hypothetical protein
LYNVYLIAGWKGMMGNCHPGCWVYGKMAF